MLRTAQKQEEILKERPEQVTDIETGEILHVTRESWLPAQTPGVQCAGTAQPEVMPCVFVCEEQDCFNDHCAPAQTSAAQAALSQI